MRQTLKQHKRAISLLALGAIVGAILISPAGAHVGGTINHLWGGSGHIKSKVQKHGDARYMRLGRTGFLPKGKTITGSTVLRHEASSLILAPITFQVPLNFSPTVVIVDMGDATPPTGCPGTASDPRANPGFACIYTGWTTDTDLHWDGAWDPADGGTCGCRNGIAVYNIGTAGEEISAVWAVTAPTSTTAATSAAPGRTRSHLTGKR